MLEKIELMKTLAFYPIASQRNSFGEDEMPLLIEIIEVFGLIK